MNAAAPSTPARILLVEDSADVAEALRVRLEAEGHTVQIAPTKAEALRAVEYLRVWDALPRDLVVILDIMLPDGSGHEILFQIRGDELLRDLPVVMLTGLGDPEMAIGGFLIGANAYLPKPFDTEKLLGAIQVLLQERRAAA